MLSTQRAQSDSCPEFHLLIICLLAEHMVHFHAIRGTTNSWKSLTKNNVHKIRSSFLYSFVSDKKPDPCPIKINDYFGSCHLKIWADGAINMWQEFQLCRLPVYMSSQKRVCIYDKDSWINGLWGRLWNTRISLKTWNLVLRKACFLCAKPQCRYTKTLKTTFLIAK